VIVYEHPLSERIRTLLRLEDLFERIDYFVGKTDGEEHHVALLLIFEILEVASRADLKSDLLQELERQKQVLEALRDNPDISEEALENVLWQIDQSSSRLFQASGKVGQELRENEWLMSIKQRTRSRRRLRIRPAFIPLLAAAGAGCPPPRSAAVAGAVPAHA
jgi:cell division protein ZapD